jgi:hypothetical protein
MFSALVLWPVLFLIRKHVLVFVLTELANTEDPWVSTRDLCRFVDRHWNKLWTGGSRERRPQWQRTLTMTLSKGRDILFASGQSAKGKKGFWSLINNKEVAALSSDNLIPSADGSVLRPPSQLPRGSIDVAAARFEGVYQPVGERSRLDELADIAEKELDSIESSHSSSDGEEGAAGSQTGPGEMPPSWPGAAPVLPPIAALPTFSPFGFFSQFDVRPQFDVTVRPPVAPPM